jgi:flagellar hook-associated protein 1 FlgK
MGTLTALLNLSQNSLQASQAAIDITANNVANANTPGYTAKVATWQESDTVRIGGTVVAGEGASVGAVSQRDTVLNHRINQQTQQEASSSAESVALNDVQSIFGITSTSTSALTTMIGANIDSFFNSLSALEASPSSSSVRQAVLNAAGTLASNFNSASNQIAQQIGGLNQQVSGAVSQVNTLTASIAALNLQIGSTSPNSDAGPLEDQRQQDLSQLSGLIGFDQTRTENNGLTLTTADGTVLVSGGKSFVLGNATVNGSVDILSATGVDITSDLTGGSLGGILQARDHDLPLVASFLDNLAYGVGNAVNAQNAAGLDAKGNPGGAIFALPAASVRAASVVALATTDPSAIAAAAVGQGSSGGTNASLLSGLADSNIAGGQTAAGFYASFLTQLGSTVSRVSEENTTQKASLTQLTTQQSAQSSVSLDQEAANLTLYERSYNAAARVFTIVDQLMAVALNLGQPTTVT